MQTSADSHRCSTAAHEHEAASSGARLGFAVSGAVRADSHSKDCTLASIRSHTDPNTVRVRANRPGVNGWIVRPSMGATTRDYTGGSTRPVWTGRSVREQVTPLAEGPVTEAHR